MSSTIDREPGIEDVDVVRVEHDNAYRRTLADRFVARVGVDIDHTGLRPAIRTMFPQLARRGSEAAASKLVGTIATILVNGPIERDSAETDDDDSSEENEGDARSAVGSATAVASRGAGSDRGGAGPKWLGFESDARRDRAAVAASSASPLVAVTNAAADRAPEAKPRRTATSDFGFPSTYGELSARQKRTLEEFCRQRIEGGERDANVVLARLRERYGWPYTKQTFCVGPWRMARQRHRHATELRESAPPLPAVVEAGSRDDSIVPAPLTDDADAAERIRFTGERGLFAAQRTSGDTWLVEIRANVGREDMLRFQARAFDLLFPGAVKEGP